MPLLSESKLRAAVDWKDKNDGWISITKPITKDDLKNATGNIEFLPKDVPEFKIKRNLSRYFRDLVKAKTERTREIIGCSPIFLRRHLESLWQPGMSWENYGLHGWHIDHIIPVKAFDFLKKEDGLKCFHYTNLQPLWAKDNILKGDRMPDGSLARDIRSDIAEKPMEKIASAIN